jgi:butyryl-CoA dehydrogenase
MSTLIDASAAAAAPPRPFVPARGGEAPSPYFTAEHHEYRERVYDFAVREIKPIAREHDREQKYPWATVKRMAEEGLLGICWPEELGGAGRDTISYFIALHQLGRIDAAHSLICSAQNNLDAAMIMEAGTDEQKQRYIPLMATGRALGAFGLTEPQAGSDASALETTAEDRGDHYVLNGRKHYITQAGVAEVVIIAARTGQGSKGLTSFILHKDCCDLASAKAHGIGHAPELPRTPGFSYGRTWEKMGWRAVNWGELVMENAVVPKENILGEVGGGYSNFLRTLDGGRIGIAAVSLGIAEGAYDEALAYAGSRKAFGKYIAGHQGTAFHLANMATEIYAAKQMVYHAAWLKQHGLPYKLEAAQAKLFASELAMRATTLAVQIFGGIGYTNEVPVERMMRDAKVCEIGEGTSEILRMLIARQLTGLPNG